MISINHVNAETERYCRYKIHDVMAGNVLNGAGRAIQESIRHGVIDCPTIISWVPGLCFGITDFTNLFRSEENEIDARRNQLRRGILGHTMFEVIERDGQLLFRPTESSRHFTVLSGEENLPRDSFYSRDRFVCPNALCTHVDINGFVNINLVGDCARGNLSNSDYHRFVRIHGPSVRMAGSDSAYDDSFTCHGVLGGFRQDLEGALNIIRIVAPLMVLGLSAYDFLAAIFDKDAELLKKANSRLLRRLALVAILFFLPTMINIVLGIIDSSYITCVG